MMRVLFICIRCYNETRDMNLLGLKVSGEVLQEGITVLPGWNTVIANQRESNDKDLTAVGGISDGFWVTHHTRLEDEFTCDALVCAKTLTIADMAILQLESHIDETIRLLCRQLKMCFTVRGEYGLVFDLEDWAKMCEFNPGDRIATRAVAC